MSTTITVKSSDNKEFIVEKETLFQSIMVKNMVGDLEVDTGVIPLPNESSINLVIEWLEHHKDDEVVEEDDHRSRNQELPAWDKQYMDVDEDMMREIILAANYLDIKGLLKVACKAVADKIKHLSVAEIRQYFELPAEGEIGIIQETDAQRVAR